ncbi:MAG TPA: hypothetical protein VL134_10685 [Leptolyngbya sp.]|jgi:predicted transposase YdaD|nr:hypothetical protein [Leptolyngbya sp.]
MRESVIYQDILQEGRQEGEQLAIGRVAINMLRRSMPLKTIPELTETRAN